MTALGARVDRVYCPIGSCPWTHDREAPGEVTRTFADGASPLHDGAAATLQEAIADAVLGTLLHEAVEAESVIRAHLETHTLVDWVREVMRLREAKTPAPVRWLGESNCADVFALLGWDHPEDELDHSAIHGLGPHRDESAQPGDWIVPDGHGWYRPATLVPRRVLDGLVEVARYVSLGRGAVGHQSDGAPYPDSTARFALGELADHRDATGGADACG